jgi:hypothetical protein
MTFGANAGVTGNGSAWGFAAAPEGDQVAFLRSSPEGTGSIKQTVTNLVRGGTYYLSFQAAQRPGYGLNPVTVKFNGVELGTFTPQSGSFSTFTTIAFQATGTTGTLEFTGTPSNGDAGTGIDAVSVKPFRQWALAPVVLDLQGSGLANVFRSDVVNLDVDGTGYTEQVRWFSQGFGILALDVNGDGTINSGVEISFTQYQPGAVSDLEGLKAFDSDADGSLTAGDGRFHDFLMWQDANGDGLSQQGELLSLPELGIASISLAPTPTGQTLNNASGNVILNSGSFTWSDGRVGRLADVVLRSAQALNVSAEPPQQFQLQPANDFNRSQLEFEQSRLNRKVGAYEAHYGGGQMYLMPRDARGAIDARADAIGPAATLSFTDTRVGMLSPIVLDLDGDGIELRSRKKAKAHFDMDGDGSRDDTGWHGKGDGFLVVDSNGDGRITSGAELSLLSQKVGAGSVFEALAVFDSDKNGKVDEKDSRFAELRIWADRNGNGRTDTGELATLTSHGIVSIGLNALPTQGRVKVGENAVLGTTTFTFSDGRSRTAAAAALAFKPAGAAQLLTNTLGIEAADLNFGRWRGYQLDDGSTSSEASPQLSPPGELRNFAGVLPQKAVGEPFGPAHTLPHSPEHATTEELDPRITALRAGLGHRGEVEGSFLRVYTLEAGSNPFEPLLGWTDVSPASGRDEVASAWQGDPAALDARLAHIVQEMAGFGARRGESNWRERSHADSGRFDYFAP